MKFFAASVAAASVLPCILATLTVDTPTSLTVCEPSLLEWSGGTAPYYLSIIPGGDTSGSALKTFDATNATEYTWTVDIAADTEVTIELKDSTGTIAYSDEVDIASGSTTSCVSSSTAASASAGATDTSSSSTASSDTSATTTASDDSDTSTSTGTGTSTSSATTSSSSSNASRAVISYAAVGLASIVCIAML